MSENRKINDEELEKVSGGVIKPNEFKYNEDIESKWRRKKTSKNDLIFISGKVTTDNEEDNK